MLRSTQPLCKLTSLPAHHLERCHYLLHLPPWSTSRPLEIFKKLFWDDVFAILAWLLALSTATIWQVSSKSTYQSLAVWLCFYTGLWAVKISFLLFFKRLGQNVASQQILWWCVFVFTVVAYVISMGDMPYTCLADSFDKFMRDCNTESFGRHEKVVLWVNCILDIVSDYMSM